MDGSSLSGVDAARAARQFVSGAALFGVDFVPVGGRGGGVVEGAAGGASVDGDASASGVDGSGVAGDGKAGRLAALRAAYEADDSSAARLISGWTNVVFDTGDPDAAVMFIGEAPGADEDREGVPFVGRAGQLLGKMIGAMGLSRESVYIANVLKVRPPGNRDPLPAETAADLSYLRSEIEIVSPSVLVCLGKPATNTLLDRSGPLGAVRGVWQSYACVSGRSVPVMPTYHPAYLLRQYTDENRRVVWSDLRAVMERVGLG